MLDLTNKKILILGLGKSGVSAARLCRARGAEVIATDLAPLEQLSEAARSLDARLVAGTHDGISFNEVDLIVVSPGVPPLPELEAASASGVPVIGELELACRFSSGPIVAVGGTNGKSTTTTLVGGLLEAAGLRVFVGGNLGTPASEAVGGDWEAIVLEVSSFQLERAPSFHPKVSLLLNVTEDHLDRYPSFRAYADAKGNAFVNQSPEDFAIVPAGDALCQAQARRGAARLIRFGVAQPSRKSADANETVGDYVLEKRVVVERASGERFSLERVPLHGIHNLENAAAAIAAARALQVSAAAVNQGLARFRPLPHRMALAGTIDGIRFYDDSKGTNVGAAVTALGGLEEHFAVLIAGGRDKLGSYQPLVDALERKGRAAVVIGEASERIAQAIGARLPVERAASLEQAVEVAFRLARRGDAVLLSPACSSFDMFQSYAERGERFVLAVERLAQRTRAGASP